MKATKIYSANTHEDALFEMSSERTKKNIDFLNHVLATEFGLFTKSLNYHWNVTGPRFHSLHVFLESHYRELLEIMDNVAERIRVLGSNPISTVSGMAKEMDLVERSGNNLSANDMLKDLYDVNIELQSMIKDVVGIDDRFRRDPGTEDFLIGLLKKHEEMGWMLRAHLV